MTNINYKIEIAVIAKTIYDLCEIHTKHDNCWHFISIALLLVTIIFSITKKSTNNSEKIPLLCWHISDRMNGWMHVFNCVWVGDILPIVFPFHIFLGFILNMEWNMSPCLEKILATIFTND
jgi:hypothetical protein